LGPRTMGAGVLELAEPEVGDLEVAARVEKQVLGLEVAVVLMRLWQNLTAVTSC